MKDPKPIHTEAIQGVQFINLPRQHKLLKKELLQAISEVIDSGRFILGPEVEALEKEVAAVCQAKHAVAMNSGTDALLLALRALNVGPGDEVIVPDFTFVATATAVLLAGATPVMVDVEPETLTLDLRQAAQRINRKTRAIIPVHLYGQPVDMTALLKLAKDRKVAVVEDACQSLAARWRNRPVGALGEIGCLSFFPTKNLGALGDAGMALTNNERLAKRMRRLRDHGSDRKYLHEELGYNSRLDAIQAAALRVKLKFLAAWNAGRQDNARMYLGQLKDLPLLLPKPRPFAQHVYHQFAVRTSRRDELKAYLAQRKIETAIHYPLPLHAQPLLAHLPSAKRSFPVASRASREVLCLPITPESQEQEIQIVINAIRGFFQR